MILLIILLQRLLSALQVLDDNHQVDDDSIGPMLGLLSQFRWHELSPSAVKSLVHGITRMLELRPAEVRCETQIAAMQALGHLLQLVENLSKPTMLEWLLKIAISSPRPLLRLEAFKILDKLSTSHSLDFIVKGNAL